MPPKMAYNKSSTSWWLIFFTKFDIVQKTQTIFIYYRYEKPSIKFYVTQDIVINMHIVITKTSISILICIKIRQNTTKQSMVAKVSLIAQPRERSQGFVIPVTIIINEFFADGDIFRGEKYDMRILVYHDDLGATVETLLGVVHQPAQRSAFFSRIDAANNVCVG